MYLPKGILKTKIKEKNFYLNIEILKSKQLGIDSNFSGYVRVFCTNLQDLHDDYCFLIENGKIIAAEKIEIERKIRTVRNDVFNRIGYPYKECEISVVRLDKLQLDMSRDTNESCILDGGVPLMIEGSKEELLERISTKIV